MVLTNGGQGRGLIDEVVRAIATDYGWSDIAAPAIEEKVLTRAQLARVAGTFTGGPRPERVVALSVTRFRTDMLGIVVQFAPDYASFDIVEGGPPIRLVRSIPEVSKPGTRR